MNAGATTIDILHIDDNPCDLDLFRTAFEECGPAVHYLGETNPVAAMADLGKRAAILLPLPSLVVIDLNMPEARGQDVLAFLRRHSGLRGLPAVILTTSDRRSEAEQCRSLGARGIYRKPNRFDDMLIVARSILAHAAI